MLPDDQHLDSPGPVDPDLVSESIGLPGYLRVLNKISQGGIGAVFKVEHADSRQTLAVKVLLPQLAALERHRRRFMQEAEAICSLDNPHIVKVHECAVSSSGLPYIVMDYIEGITLEEFLGDRYPDTAQAVEIFIQTAEAVAHAHQHGIIHRDLKPSNIMLVKEDGRFCVKVLDFGIAKITEESGLDAVGKLTATGELLGTPSYMSPEQSLGFKIDKRSDIYSLGCLMCHTLTGTPPFTAATALQLLAKHTNRQAPEMKALRPDLKLPTALDQIVKRTLEKSPADRYSSMEALLIDLRKVKDGARLSARMTGNQRRQLRIAINVLILFSIFYFVGQYIPAMIANLEHHWPYRSSQELASPR